LENWRETSYYVDEDFEQDLKFNKLQLNKATDMAQNRPLWRLVYTFGATHS